MNYTNYQQWSTHLIQERTQLRQHQDKLLPQIELIQTEFGKAPLQPLPQVEGFLDAQSAGKYQKAQANKVLLKEADQKIKTANSQIPKIQAQLKNDLSDLQMEYDQLKGQWIAFWITLATVFLVIFLLWKLL